MAMKTDRQKFQQLRQYSQKGTLIRINSLLNYLLTHGILTEEENIFITVASARIKGVLLLYDQSTQELKGGKE